MKNLETGHSHRRKPALRHSPHIEELQTDLFRLEARMSSRLENVFRDLEATEDAERRNVAMSRRLVYATATLDIAVAPNPELNLFDMIAFLEISRNALSTYWNPREFGTAGTPIVDAFDASITEAWEIAENVLSVEQRNHLSAFIRLWIEHHPSHHITETLRFSRFSEALREEVPNMDARGVERLIQHADRALTTADATRLLAERAFYYSQRVPFLVRLQGQVATFELLTESFCTLQSAPLLKKAPQLLMDQALVRAETLIVKMEQSGMKLISTTLILYFGLRMTLNRFRSTHAK